MNRISDIENSQVNTKNTSIVMNVQEHKHQKSSLKFS